ncbi:unnamed protein product [Oncorhynchus mykiss]|uniref:Uncharacterized protein n=1 Tax=Oncorhynchus mykiss TaxID=8022 RepID=A0A060XY67_ONCMY|nr:unnamed protein product [Oncorhynchus mykiss]
MTLTRGSFTYTTGEEYHGEWKEGKTSPLLTFSIKFTSFDIIILYSRHIQWLINMAPKRQCIMLYTVMQAFMYI